MTCEAINIVLSVLLHCSFPRGPGGPPHHRSFILCHVCFCCATKTKPRLGEDCLAGPCLSVAVSRAALSTAQPSYVWEVQLAAQ